MANVPSIVALQNPGNAGQMGHAKSEQWTYTTDTNNYVVVCTVAATHLLVHYVTMTSTTNTLLYKLEASRDGTTFFTLVEDYSVAAAATQSFVTTVNCLQYRISVKPAVAATHGTATVVYTGTADILDPNLTYAFAYESLTVTNGAAVSLTIATYDAARHAMITVENNPIRFRIDGTAPTTTEGHLVASGDTIDLDYSTDIYHFKAIATGANATIRVTYSR